MHLLRYLLALWSVRNRLPAAPGRLYVKRLRGATLTFRPWPPTPRRRHVRAVGADTPAALEARIRAESQT